MHLIKRSVTETKEELLSSFGKKKKNASPLLTGNSCGQIFISQHYIQYIGHDLLIFARHREGFSPYCCNMKPPNYIDILKNV